MPAYEYCGLAVRGNPCAQVGLSFRWLVSEPFERGLRSVPNGSESKPLTDRSLVAELSKPHLRPSWRGPDGHVVPRMNALRQKKFDIHPGEPSIGLRHRFNIIKHLPHCQYVIGAGRVKDPGSPLLDHSDRPFSQVAGVDELHRVFLRLARSQDFATARNTHRPIGEAIGFIAGPYNQTGTNDEILVGEPF